MMEPPTTKEAAVAAVHVFWGIQMCPVPVGCDARRVGPCIKRYLRELGYSGPITITAVGVLSDVPVETLEAVFSTGISLRTGPHDLKQMAACIHGCAYGNPPPINIMIISAHPLSFNILCKGLVKRGYNIIQASGEVLSQNILLADPEEDMCSKTGEPANWVCGVCRKLGRKLSGHDFENFITHLYSQEHEQELPQWYPENASTMLPRLVKRPLVNVTKVAAPLRDNATSSTMASEDGVKHKKKRLRKR